MLYRLVTTILLLTLLFSSLSLHAQGIPGEGDNGGGGTPGTGGGNTGTGGGGNINPGQEDSVNPTPAAFAVNLLNASFETGTDAPDNWMPFTHILDETHTWDSGTVSSGARSISVRYTRYFYGRWTSDAVAVEGDGFQWYTLTGQVKTLGNNGEVYLLVAWLNQDGDILSTSDSSMLPEGDNDWSTLTVSALQPDGAVKLSVWCISNHNAGQTWFDDVELTRTAFTTDNTVSYAQFLIDYPSHLLAIEANVMQVQELATKAKWTKEDDFYNSDGQLRASKFYAQAAGIKRNDTVFSSVISALHEDSEKRAKALAEAKARFDGLIDDALWSAVRTSEAGGDTDKAQEYLSILEERGADVGPVGTTGVGDESGNESPPIPE